MTDIIEQLEWDKRYTNGHVPVTMDRAIKEIERLRAELRRRKGMYLRDTGKLIDALSWIEDHDPQIVDAAREKFKLVSIQQLLSKEHQT